VKHQERQAILLLLLPAMAVLVLLQPPMCYWLAAPTPVLQETLRLLLLPALPMPCCPATAAALWCQLLLQNVHQAQRLCALNYCSS
jgi:hypothetical protein